MDAHPEERGVGMKKCSECKEIKPEFEFHLTGYIKKNGEFTRKNICKSCRAKCLRDVNEKNTGKRLGYNNRKFLPHSNVI